MTNKLRKMSNLIQAQWIINKEIMIQYMELSVVVYNLDHS